MCQLLVRDIEKSLVATLKKKAAANGISAEELHRRILREALSRPDDVTPSLIEFLTSSDGEAAPEVELDLERSRDLETTEVDFG
jgi:plasmid stability protein